MTRDRGVTGHVQDALPLLTVLPVLHDLPPSWDGQRVEVARLVDAPHLRSVPRPPDSCGSTDEPATNLGLLHPLPGDTFIVDAARKSHRSGRTYYASEERPAWPVVCLCAFRCPRCQHDQVLDNRDDSFWDLDASDYTDRGSA